LAALQTFWLAEQVARMERLNNMLALTVGGAELFLELLRCEANWASDGGVSLNSALCGPATPVILLFKRLVNLMVPHCCGPHFTAIVV
jgi:hypothetical protein